MTARPQREAAGLRCSRQSALGERDRRLARQDVVAPAFLQNGEGVGTDAGVDMVERGALGAAAILGGGADHPAGIGDEVRHHQDAARVQRLLGLVGAGMLAPCGISRVFSRLIVGAHHVGTAGRDPDVAFDVDDRVAVALLPARVIT